MQTKMSVARRLMARMDIPEPVREVAEMQEWVVSRAQLVAAGVSAKLIKHRAGRGRWQQLYRGIYALFTGAPTRSQWRWAAVLRAGAGAALSHHTAAELHGMVKEPQPDTPIHVTVPATRHLETRNGLIIASKPDWPTIVVHMSRRVVQATQPNRAPARTTIEETALDLTQVCRRLDDVVGWITRAFGSWKTNETKLREALLLRKKVCWRNELNGILTAAGDGVHSPLEYRYYRYVEKAHGLPSARRQVKVTIDGKSAYRDVYYDEYRVAVELDGALAHPDTQRPEDRHRDVVASAEGIVTVRFGWSEVAGHPCETAALQARVLKGHGWTGAPKPCRPGCPVGAFLASAG